MSKTASLAKTIPSKEIPIHFSEKGSVTSRAYEGTFTVKVPSVREMSQIGIELAKLNGGVRLEFLDSSTAALNNALAYLSVVVQGGPDWWFGEEAKGGIEKGLATVDVNVPVVLFQKCDEAVQGWYKALKGDTAE